VSELREVWGYAALVFVLCAAVGVGSGLLGIVAVLLVDAVL
jgi:hypothetical protein